MNRNKRAIVTGGTRGIGRAIVMELINDPNHNGSFTDVVFIYNSCDECAEDILKEIGPARCRRAGRTCSCSG